MAVLYRKYRPQVFAEVLNQKPIIQTLHNQIKAGQIAHAYLFTGSRGVGKTSVARILAKAVNCKGSGMRGEGSVDACGECDVCKQIENNNFIDLIEIDAASNTGVDNVRELIEHVKFAPSVGKFKVFIIDEVHMLSKGAFNALLKTLEEPPKHVVFILATTEINKVPATIISRTQRFDFKALSVSDISNHLTKIVSEEKIELDPQIINLIALAAEGSVRDSLSLLGKILTLGSNATLAEAQQLLGVTDISVCEDLLNLIALGKTAEIPEFFDKLLEIAPDYKILNRDFLEYLRKVLVYKTAGNIENLSENRYESIKKIAELLSLADLMFIIRLFLRSYKDLEYAPSAELPVLISAIEAALKKNSNKEVVVKSIKTQAPTSSPFLESKIVETVNELEKVEQLAAVPEVNNINEFAEINLEEALLLWPKVIAKIKLVNGPLSSLLRTASVIDTSGGRIILGVKFLFDKQSIENSKNLGLINSTLTEVFGKAVGIRAEVIKDNKEALKANEVISGALQVFGGELVE